jgi:hypothetical protein
MYLLIEALNRPSESFKRRNSKISWVFVIITILVVTVFDPIINYLVNGTDYYISIAVSNMFMLFLFGCLTYLAMCFVFWIVCKAFGSQTSFALYFRAWGISYIPTIICAVTVALAETFFYLFWNNSILGIVLNIIFVTILIWKCTLYVLFLHQVAQLKGKRLVGAFLVGGLFILVIAFINIAIGLKTPIL